jgi:hypothetical protein
MAPGHHVPNGGRCQWRGRSYESIESLLDGTRVELTAADSRTPGRWEVSMSSDVADHPEIESGGISVSL